MSACGEKLTNLGKKQQKVWTNEGKLAMATFQCADVTRPLCSVSKICDERNRFVFGHGDFIESQSGVRTSFKWKNNLQAWRCTRKKGESKRRGLLGRANAGRRFPRRARETHFYFNV